MEADEDSDNREYLELKLYVSMISMHALAFFVLRQSAKSICPEPTDLSGVEWNTLCVYQNSDKKRKKGLGKKQ